MKPYSELLRDPRWQRMRLEIMARDKWACTKCGDANNELNVHHHHYRKGKKPWEYMEWELTTLCRNCHAGHHIEPQPPKPPRDAAVTGQPVQHFTDSYHVSAERGRPAFEIPVRQKFQRITEMKCRHGNPPDHWRYMDKGSMYWVRLIGGALDGMEVEVLDQGQICDWQWPDGE